MSHQDIWSISSAIAQIVATLFAGFTILVGVRALREVRKDRSLRARPYLLFDHGGFIVEVEEVKDIGVPGVNPRYALSAMRKAGMAVSSTWRAKHKWGRLVNHGVGSAIGVKIVVVTKDVTRSGEQFEIDTLKLQSCPYELNMNTIPSSPSHIKPGQFAQFLRIPTLIVLDGNCLVSEANCEIIIRYKDIYGERFESRQELLISDFRRMDGTILLSIGDGASFDE